MLDELSRETRRRARPVKGGKTICSRCAMPRVSNSTYCREHKNEHFRIWKRGRSKKALARESATFKRLAAQLTQEGTTP